MSKIKIFTLLVSSLLLSACSFTKTGTPKPKKITETINNGGQLDCQVSNLTDGTKSQVIISGNKIKFVGISVDKTKKQNIISLPQANYIWFTGESTGTKVALSQISNNIAPDKPKIGAQSLAESYDNDRGFRLNCTTRNISDSEFDPPSDITFTDNLETQKNQPK